ncbi:putative cytochrome p450 protein [Botrytis fragariae]|uniref:Putative cytochrome p450 protein n=1 Tax=Botrytis fragariae TaxID=1964551 RepID=A0A8H6AKG2_9HELO|nr:putative cytochrome p450 protein [Botrytis fragariae]KAF5869064.1 putative cytochrome p450 protein [Botrytis fragariae]
MDQMESLTTLMSLQNLAAAIVVYFGSFTFYRLFLHPLSRFPGPELAAITKYYEAYYDIVQDGQYTFRIAEMHIEHGTGQIVNLGAAPSAFTRDVSTEFILGKSYNSLDEEDFDIGMTSVFQGSGHIWRITKHITWFAPTMKSIPVDWVMKVADDGTKAFFRYLKETTHDTKEFLAAIALSDPDDKAPHNIVHEILDSNLPAEDKKFERVFDDVATVTGAGFKTTASVLRLIIFHVFNSPEILKRLLKTLEQLPYLTSILMEGMRLSPAIASRSARISPDGDLTCGKWRIPSGTPIGMTTLLMHTDEKLYPDPIQFKPGRWMDIDARRKHDKIYAAFSKKTRICLGMNLAGAEMYMLLATLVQRFDFHFEGVTSEDFECESDQFIIGTSGKGVLNAFATSYK